MTDNNQWELMFQGAESRVFFGTHNGQSAVKKERFKKAYRHPELDESLTKQRQRAEIKAINKLRQKCPDLEKVMPLILFTNDREIIMTCIENAQTSCRFIETSLASSVNIDWIFQEIGKIVGQIHKNDLIHVDLTTSNILVNDKNQLTPIDFGLAYHSTSSEDRAVDLYVLERALLSTHVDESKFDIVIDNYKKVLGNSGDVVIKKLDEVRMRGRKRLMLG